MNVLSLFDGISCGQVALQRLGIKPDFYFASEVDKRAIATTMRHFPKTIQIGDVTRIDYKQLPKIDLLLGGSPCQGFSPNATSKKGGHKGLQDVRSNLFFEYHKAYHAITDANPDARWLLENVRMKNMWADTITAHMNRPPVILCSSIVSAQKRRRMYWCSHIINPGKIKDRGVLLDDVIDYKDQSYTICKLPSALMRHILSKLPECIMKTYAILTSSTMTSPTSKGVRRTFGSPCEKYGSGYSVFSAVGNLHILFDCLKQNYVRVRLLNSLELERCQTLPDNYTYTRNAKPSDRCHQVGNGWTVDVIVELLSQILQLRPRCMPC